MTVYRDKARGIWRYNFTLNGVRHSRDCIDAAGQPVPSRRAALAAEAMAKRHAGLAPKLVDGSALTLADVAAALMPAWQRGSDWANTQRYVRDILAHFGAAKPIATFDEAAIADYIDYALTQPARIWKGGARKPGKNTHPSRARVTDPLKNLDRMRSANTVNHYLVPLRQIVKRAATMIDPQTGRKILPDPPKVPVLRIIRRKPRPVPDAVLPRLFELMTPHAAQAVMLTLCFGLRRREVFGLTLSHLDFAAGGLRLAGTETKNKSDEFLPGAPEAMAFCALLAGEAMGRGTRYLITWQRRRPGPWQPVRSAKRAWDEAMDIIETEFGQRWRWHDLRAAYITQLAMHAPGAVVQSMARHADYHTTRLYIEVTDAIRAEAARGAIARPALRAIAGKK